MLQKLFYPRSIAVVGASHTPGKLGYDVLQNILQGGFRGAVYAVNPHVASIAQRPTYATVSAIAAPVNVAVIVVPAALVPAVLRDCGKAHVPYAVVISAGFKEVGADGATLERDIRQIAQRYHIRLIGPNCLGYITVDAGVNASFAGAGGLPRSGGVSFVSQSGAMAVALLDWARQSRLGFSKIISIGNKADLDEVDCLEYLGADRRTRVIMMYLESIDDGRRFMTVASRVARRKPIIVLKAGASQQAQTAVSSHTGSLAGSDQVVAAALQRCGVVRARTVEEFFDFGLSFSMQPLPRSPRAVVITNAGGPGIMAVDAAAYSAVTLPLLPADVQHTLRAGLPPAANVHNPIDVIGDATPERYDHALRTVLASRAVDSAVVILTPQVMTQAKTIAALIARTAQASGKTVLASFMGGDSVLPGRLHLEVNSVPNFSTPERAVRALSAMIDYRQQRITPIRFATPRRPRPLPPSGHHPQIRTLEAEKILARYQLPVLQSTLVRRLIDCNHITQFPLVMKVASRDIVHKSKSGAVILNITSAAQARAAYKRIQRSVYSHNPHAEWEGVLVQPQLHFAHPPTEMILGLKRDPAFGPVLLCGMGGTFVEVLQDVSCAIAPLTLTQARAMIASLRFASLLAQADTSVAANILVTLGRIAADYPAISSLDINPCMLDRTGHGGYIVDARIMV